MIIVTTAVVQNEGEGDIAQPNNKINKSEIGTRLRRRLSNIFQRDKADIGFFTNFFCGPGANGKNQLAICQSPLIQRCLLFISTSYLEGYSSYNCTSLSNPQRA